ncbi:PfkB family carbohydrate kinase [Pedobacter sp. KLB.chiD]|uniref:PfkB family carbohydrate kinase n=1 Tax=Pedobacter sp. KLB.chiD TaxID=3387402 RepID=UPI0039998D06
MKNTSAPYRQFLENFKNKKILVIGDLILDRYIQGECTRIAPEASVPVIDVHSEKNCPGGAANVAANLKALGAQVILCSVTGVDRNGHILIELLKKLNIDTDLIVSEPERDTLCKTRVSSLSQLIVRYDEGSCSPISKVITEKLMKHISSVFDQVDAILISDYEKGVLTDDLILALKTRNNGDKKIFAVDARNFARYATLEPTLIKPNYTEALALCRFKPVSLTRLEQAKNWGECLYKYSGAKNILLSMDEDGVCCFKKGQFSFHQTVPKVANPQVSGAGDTFLATALMALLSGTDLYTVTTLAISAASVVISEPHTAVCHIARLKDNFSTKQKYLNNLSEIGMLMKHYKSQGKRIVFTNGCFDILHSGHVNYLKGSKAQGDILIVGLNNDESIKRLKGLQRPINAMADRIEVLSELSCIDHIISFGQKGDDTPIPLLKKIRPHVFVKGGDYRNKFLPEGNTLHDIGCKIVFLPTVADRSTTKIIGKIEQNFTLFSSNNIN